ncbi:MAG: Trk system potassium transporter TrkA [Planctomycetaceae bacterium]
MNVVVLGAGTVGRTVSELLCGRGVNVCVIDQDAAVLRRVEEQLDVRTVCGSAYDVSKLFQAGIQLADLCLAVTSRDEVNLVSASIAREMGAARSVARVFNPILRDTSTFDYQRHFHVDRLISLEHLTALELARHIRTSSVLAVESFARGAVEVQGIQVGQRAKAIGVSLRELELPSNVRVGLITHNGKSIIPGASDSVQPGDYVTLFGAHGELSPVSARFADQNNEKQRVIIAGGGEIGLNLARLLERTPCRVTILENDAARCDFIAERLPHATVLHADVKSKADLEEARVGKADVFVACTGRDEENIVCGVEAKELGCRRLLTIVRSPDYANVLERLGIDVAVSPREAMARQIVGLVAKGPVRERSPIAGESAEVWEVEIRKDAPVTRGSLRELALPRCLVAAIERGDYVRVAGADDRLQHGDTAVMLVHKEGQQAVLKMLGG